MSETSTTTQALLTKIVPMSARMSEVSTTTQATVTKTLNLTVDISETSITSQITVDIYALILFRASMSETSVTTQATAIHILSLDNPTDDLTNVQIPVTFDWGSYPTAVKYNLQVASDVSFNTIIVDVWTDQRSYEITNELQEYTEYYWRVRAAA